MYEASDMLEGSPTYSRGDIVWVKLSSYWWPGEVITEEDLPADLLSDFKKPPLVIVKFFDEDSYEYVKVWSSIHPYNCDKKSEFIKKGMAGFRSKLSHMAKFPKDIGTAEERTDGNPNILSQPEFLPVKKTNYDEIFGTVSPRKPAKGKISLPSAKKTPGKDNNQPHITHRRFLGNDDYRAYICIQYPGKDRQWDSDDEEIKKLNQEPEKVLVCHSCSFKTRRLEVMILHTKMHIQGIYVTSKRKPKKAKGADVGGTDSESDAAASIKSPKPKQRKKKEVKPKNTDVFTNLLDEWDDTDEEMEEPITPKKPKRKAVPVAEKKSLDSEKKEPQNDRTENKTTPIEASNNGTTTTAHTEPIKSESSLKNTYDDIKNCFDFDEEEEDEDFLVPASVGRKIPRVIPEKPKPSISELLEQSQKEDELEEKKVSSESAGGKGKAIESSKSAETGADGSKKEILRLSQSVNKAPDVDENIENTFKELMAETELPPLDDLAQNLKPEQNFHDARTVKFPDKGGTALKGDTTSTGSSKKRFVTSFEDFEAGFRKLEDEQKMKQLGGDKEAKTTKPSTSPRTLLDPAELIDETTESKEDRQELKEVPSEASTIPAEVYEKSTSKKSPRSNESTAAKIDIISTASVVEKNVKHTDTIVCSVGRRKTRQSDKEARTDSAVHQQVDARESKDVISDKAAMDSKRKSSRRRTKQFVIEEDSEEIIEINVEDTSEQIVGHLDEKTREKLAAIDLEIQTLKNELELTQSTSETDEVPDNKTEGALESATEEIVTVDKETESFEAENSNLAKDTNKLTEKTDVPELEHVLKKSQRTTRLSLSTETLQKVDEKIKQLSELTAPVSETPSKAKRKITQKSPLTTPEQSDLIKDLAVKSFIEICDESEELPIKGRRNRSRGHQKNVEIDEREKDILTSILGSDGTESKSMASSLESPDGFVANAEESILKEKVDVEVDHEKDTLLSICTEVSSDPNIELRLTQETTKVDLAPQESSDELKANEVVIHAPIEPELTPRSKNSRSKNSTKKVPLDKITPVELSESIVVSSDLSSQKPVLPIESQTTVPDLPSCSSIPKRLEPPTPKSRRGRSQKYIKEEITTLESIKTPKDVPEPKQDLADTIESDSVSQPERHVVEIHEEPIPRTRGSRSRKFSENQEHSTVVEELILKNLESETKPVEQSSAEPKPALPDVTETRLLEHHADEVQEHPSPRTRSSRTRKSCKELEQFATIVEKQVITNFESEANVTEQSSAQREQTVTDTTTHLIDQPAHHVDKLQEEPISKTRSGRTRKLSLEQEKHATVVEEQVLTNLELEASVTEQSSAEPEQAVTDTTTHLIDQPAHHVDELQEKPVSKTRSGRVRRISVGQEQRATVVEEQVLTNMELEASVTEQSSAEPEQAVTDTTTHLIDQPAHHVDELQEKPISKTRSGRVRRISVEQEQRATVEEQVLTNLESEASVTEQSSAEPEQAPTDTTTHLIDQPAHHVDELQEKPVSKTRSGRVRRISVGQEQRATVVEEQVLTNMELEASVTEQSSAEPEQAVTDTTTHLIDQPAHHVDELQEKPISKTRSGRVRRISVEQEQRATVEEQVLTNLESEASVTEQSSAEPEQAPTDTTTHLIDQPAHPVKKVQEEPIPKTRRSRTRKFFIEQEHHATVVEEQVLANLESEANVTERSSAELEQTLTDTSIPLVDQPAHHVGKVQDEPIPKTRRGRTRKFSIEQEQHATVVEEQVLTNLESEASVAVSAEPEQAVTDTTMHLVDQTTHHIVKVQKEPIPKTRKGSTRKLSMDQEQHATSVEGHIPESLESELKSAEHSIAEPEQAVTDNSTHLIDQQAHHVVKVQEEPIPKTRSGRTRKVSIEQEQHAIVVEEHMLKKFESEPKTVEQVSVRPCSDISSGSVPEILEELTPKPRRGRPRRDTKDREQDKSTIQENKHEANVVQSVIEQATAKLTDVEVEQSSENKNLLETNAEEQTIPDKNLTLEAEPHKVILADVAVFEGECQNAESIISKPDMKISVTKKRKSRSRTHTKEQQVSNDCAEDVPEAATEEPAVANVSAVETVAQVDITQNVEVTDTDYLEKISEHPKPKSRHSKKKKNNKDGRSSKETTRTKQPRKKKEFEGAVELSAFAMPEEQYSKTRRGRSRKLTKEEEDFARAIEESLKDIAQQQNRVEAIVDQSTSEIESKLSESNKSIADAVLTDSFVQEPHSSSRKSKKGKSRKHSKSKEHVLPVPSEKTADLVLSDKERRNTISESDLSDIVPEIPDAKRRKSRTSRDQVATLEENLSKDLVVAIDIPPAVQEIKNTAVISDFDEKFELTPSTRRGRPRKQSKEEQQNVTVLFEAPKSIEPTLTNQIAEPTHVHINQSALLEPSISYSAVEMPEQFPSKSKRSRSRKQAPQEDIQATTLIKETSKIPNEKQAEELSAALEFTKTVLELVEHQQTVLKTDVATEAAVQNESDVLTEEVTSHASQIEICEESDSKTRRGRSRKHVENEKVFEENLLNFLYSTVKQPPEEPEAPKAQSVIVESISSNSVHDILQEQTSKTRKTKSRKNKTDPVTTDTDNSTDVVFSTKQGMEVVANDVAMPDAVDSSTTLKSDVPLFEMPESIYSTAKTDESTPTEDTSSTVIESRRNNFAESSHGQESSGDLSITKVVEQPSGSTSMPSKITEAPLAKARRGRTRKQILEEHTEKATGKSKPPNTEPESAANTAFQAESIELDAHFSDPKVETNKLDVSSTVQNFMKDSMGSIIQKAIDQSVGTLDTIPKSGLSEWVGELLKISSSKEEGRLVTNNMEKIENKSHQALESTQVDATGAELPVEDSAHRTDKQQKLKEVETLDPCNSKMMDRTKAQQLESDRGLQLSVETKSNLKPTDIATESIISTNAVIQTNNLECIQANIDTSRWSDHKTIETLDNKRSECAGDVETVLAKKNEESAAKYKRGKSIDTSNFTAIDQLSIPETTKEIEETPESYSLGEKLNIATSHETIVEEHKELDTSKLNEEITTSAPSAQIDATSSILNENDTTMTPEKVEEITPTCLEVKNYLQTTCDQLSETVRDIAKSATLETASHEGSEHLPASDEHSGPTVNKVFPKERYKKVSNDIKEPVNQVTKLLKEYLDEAVGQEAPKSLEEIIPGSKKGNARRYTKQEGTIFGDSPILESNQDEAGSFNKATDIKTQSVEKSRQVPPKKNRWPRRESYAKNDDDTDSNNFLVEQIVQTAPDASVCEEIVIEEQVVEINDDMKDTSTIISESEGVASQSEDKNTEFSNTNKSENVSGISENSVADLTDSEFILPPKKSKRVNEVKFNFLNDSFASTTLEKKADSDNLSFPNCDDSIMSTSLRNNIEGLIKDIDSFDNGNMSDNLNITCGKDDAEKVDLMKSDVNAYSLTADSSECVKESADISKCVPPKKKKIEYDVASASLINLPSKDTEKVADTIPRPPKKKIQKLFESSQALEKLGKLNDLPQMSPLAKKKSFLFHQEEFVKSQQVPELAPQHIDVAATKEAEKPIDTGEGLLETDSTAVKPEEPSINTSDIIKEAEVSKSCIVPKKRKKRKSSCYEDHPQRKERRTSSDVDPSDTVLDAPQSQDDKQVLDTTTTNLANISVPGTPTDDNESVADDRKNEMEVNLKEDDFKFCIQTNLSNLATTAAAELSAIATATLSEIKNEVIVESSDATTSVVSENEQAQQASACVKEEHVETTIKDEIIAPSDPVMPESVALPESEFVPIALHPTVMSEKDLADAQVEITTDKVISEKKPTSLGMFSMDYLETGHIGKTISIKIKKSEVGVVGAKKVNITSGTEFTSKAMTKEFDNRALIAQPKAYALKSELLDILEGNSNSSTNSSGSEQKFKTSFDNYDKQTVVQGMFDFEEAIPSQIVLSNKVDPETVLLDSPKLLERLSMSSDVAKAKTTKKVVIQSDIKVPESISKGLISKMTKPIGTPRPGQRILIKTTKAQAISSLPKAAGNKPIILSEQIIRPANAIKITKPAIQPQGIKRQYEDIEDVETAFIIPKMAKAATSVEEEVVSASPEKPPRTRNLKIAGKAKILQQTIITPKGEIVQSQTPTPSKTTPSPLVQTQSDDTVFDINSMPIVLSDDILTPECIQNMPVVLSEDVIPHSTPMSVKVEEKVVPTLAKKIVVPHVTPKQQIVFKTTPTGATTPLQSKHMTKARILSNTPVSTIKAPKPCTTALLATGTSADGKQTKYVLVPSTVTPVVPQVKAVKPPVVKKQPVIQSKLATIQTGEPPSPMVGNKIMIVTNQHGQQTRVVLTPQQQKAFMQAQPGSKTKAIIKGAIPKGLLESAGAAGPSGVIQKVSLASVPQVATTTVSSQGGLLMTVGKGVKAPLIQSKKPVPRTPAKTQKTILIKNQMGQTVRKIQGTDDADLDRQVAEQLEAIKASARLQQANKIPEIINYTNRAIASSTTSSPKTAVRRSYAKKVDPVKVKPTVSVPHAQTQKSSEVYIPALAPLSPQPTISQVQSQVSPNLSKPPSSIKVDPPHSSPLNKALDAVSPPQVATKHESKSTVAPPVGAEGKPTDRPLTQLVIQDGLGNQTTITEGQILAIPSETVDGQPQSYMLVTLDELGNITPLNNEALMSLDPSLGLGGDLNNMVLQVDQGQGTVAALRPAEPNVPEPAKVAERLHLEPPKITPQTVPEPKLAPVEQQKPQEVPLAVEQQIVIGEGVLPGADAGGQQLIVTGDPIATQKFLESLSDGSTDLANILANAEGGSVLIQADGQQILIKTNTGGQSMLGISENTEGGGNPIFGAHKPNQDILAAALANTDVFQPSDQPAIHSSPIKGMQSSQLSPSGGSGVLYPMHVSNVLETSLTLSSPIMTPLEVPSLPNKKISDDVDILNQVPKNVDLPITITDPNISQTVAQQQAIGLMELTLPISETTVSSDMNSPSYSYSLPALDEPVGHSQKPFNGSMPLLTEDVTEMENGGRSMGKIRVAKGLQSSESSFTSTFDSLPLLPETIESSREEVVKTSCFGEIGSLPMLTEDVMDDSGSSMGSSKPPRSSPKSIERDIVDEGLSTLGGEMCSSLSEPPPDMFDLASITAKEEEISSDMSSIPEPEGETLSLHSENSGEIPIQPQIVANLNDLKRSGDEPQGQDEKRQKFD